MTFLLLFILSQASHPPGLEGIKCDGEVGKWTCKAACWKPGRPDGGTYGNVIYSKGTTYQEARGDLDRQFKNGCKP